MFLAMLHAIGFDGFADMGVTLSDNELRYILWRSYENLKEPGEHRSILGEAEDVAKQVELKVGNYGDTAAEQRRGERSINGQQEEREQEAAAETIRDNFGLDISQRTDEEGNYFYENASTGGIDLWEIKALLAKARRQIAPVRMTTRAMKHIINRHAVEFAKSAQDVANFVNYVFTHATQLRRGRGRAMFVVAPQIDTDMAAVIKIMPGDGSDYYNVETAGYYRKDKWKEDEDVIGETSEPSPSDAVSEPSKSQLPHINGKGMINAEAPKTSSAAKLGNNVGSAVNKGENVSEPEVWEQSHDENVGERTHEGTAVQNGEGNRQTGARPAQGAATTTGAGSIQAGGDNSADRLRTHERTSLQNGEDNSADRLRTHEGTSQQAGENRLRTHERTSLQSGEKDDVNAGDDVQEPEAWGKKDLLSKAEQISHGVDPELLFRDSIEDDDNTARETYNRMADEKKNIIREAWQDSMINVRNLQEAVLKQRGEKAEAWEDAYNEENRMHGRSRAESEYFTDNFYKPLLKAVNAVAKAAKVSVGDVTEYMMAKHGLERNIVFASRDAQKAYDKAHQKAQEEYEALMNAAFAESDAKKRDALMRRAQKVKFPDYDELYNHYRVRDYSGLTDLTGKDDVHEAEAEAQRIVADMESRADTSELWKATNAATEWTLKKAYESGMMSRDNYDYVRSMFSYYIPLRGWEEDTAGDLYDYVGSGDKGTAFSPTLHKAKGRRSQADNPIAYIGSMAVSAIVQGNKNKVKQTFMRFAENHPTNLITVSEMWYRNYGTDAAPDWREANKHYAPFCRSNKPISHCKKGLFTTRKSLFRKKTVKPIPPISTHIITF